MVLYTSLYHKHNNKDVQQACINSWVNAGLKCYSVNAFKEIPMLHYNGIELIPNNNFYHRNNKMYTKLDSIFESAMQKASDYFILANSDIEFVMDSEKLKELCDKTKDGLLCLNRWQYTDNKEDSIIDEKGFDTFIMHKEHLKHFIGSPFVLGLTHFDFWLPYRASKAGMKTYLCKDRLTLHKRHKLQYDGVEWQITGKWLCETENIKNFNYNTRKISDFVYSEIHKNFIVI